MMTYHSKKELDNVVGPLVENEFLRQLRSDTEVFVTELKAIFDGLIED